MNRIPALAFAVAIFSTSSAFAHGSNHGFSMGGSSMSGSHWMGDMNTMTTGRSSSHGDDHMQRDGDGRLGDHNRRHRERDDQRRHHEHRRHHHHRHHHHRHGHHMHEVIL